MTSDQVGRTMENFWATVNSGPKLFGGSLAVVGSALWANFTSVLAVLLGALFLADIVLGALKGVHEAGGFHGFDEMKFKQGFIKMGAAIVGIGLFTLADLLLHQVGVPDTWFPVATASVAGMCWGFLLSGTKNFSYFYPDVGTWVMQKLSGLKGHDPSSQYPLPQPHDRGLWDHRGPEDRE